MARGGSSRPRAVRLQVINRSRCRLPGRALLKGGAGLALSGLRGGHRVLATTLVCVGARRMERLNRRFTGRRELTDVLAFPDGEIDPLEGVLSVGEVVVCSAAARRAARKRGIPVRQELLLYAVHGWLHLAGYRDRTAAQRADMIRAEERVLRRLGAHRAE